MVYINDILRFCEEKGRKVTKAGIYNAGKTKGFIYKKNGEYQFDKGKFMAWLEKTNEKIPADYLSVKQLVEKYKISQSKAYVILKNYSCVTRKIGVRSVLYVEQKSFESAIEKHSGKHKYNWK